MLTKSGVKLLDFGLAKAMAPSAQTSSLTALPTQQGLTQEGTILGTFQYMAPEQLEGREADGRTDIFAFGAVLYEMATGKKAFSAASQASLITAIMSAEPPAISAVQPMSPVALDRVVKTCLAKDPEDRWQSASDLKRELRWIGEGSQSGVLAQPASVARRRGGSGIAWSVALLCAVAALATTVILWRSRGASAGDLGHAAAALARPGGRRQARHRVRQQRKRHATDAGRPPDDLRCSQGSGHGAAAPESRNGRDGDHPGDDGRPGPLPLSRRSLDWIRVGRRIAQGRPAGRRPVRRDGEVGAARSGLERGRQDLFSRSASTRGSAAFPRTAGPVQPVTELDKSDGEKSHRWPILLPGGKALVYAALTGRSWSEAQIVLKRLDTGERRVLVRGGTNPFYTPTGHLVYAHDGSLYAVPFDLARLAVTGQPVEVAHDVYIEPSGAAGAAIHALGTAGLRAVELRAEPPPPDARGPWRDRRAADRSPSRSTRIRLSRPTEAGSRRKSTSRSGSSTWRGRPSRS